MSRNQTASEHFLLIPESICKSRGLSPGAKLVYGRLRRFAGKDGDCYPSLARLGEEVGMSTRQAQRYLRELKAAKLVRAERRGRGKSNTYRLTRTSDTEALPPRKLVEFPRSTQPSGGEIDTTETSDLERTHPSPQVRTDVSCQPTTDPSTKESQSVLQEKKQPEETAGSKNSSRQDQPTDRPESILQKGAKGRDWRPTLNEANELIRFAFELTGVAMDRHFALAILKSAVRANGLGEILEHCQCKATKWPPRSNGWFRKVIAERFGLNDPTRPTDVKSLIELAKRKGVWSARMMTMIRVEPEEAACELGVLEQP